MMSKDHDHAKNILKSKAPKAGGVVDVELMRVLKALRKDIAQKNDLPPFAIFQEYSLEDMALKYPIRMEELININGVGEGKAKRFGQPFIELIDRYTQEKSITRPEDLIVKSTGINSALKLYLIQSIDRKLPLDDIASAKGMNMSKLITEMETIVYAGTKLNIDYWLEELLDEDQEEELYEYFMEAESDKVSLAIEEFDGDYEEEEIRLYRIKFISEVAN
jgi:ATP-dependent DNA helicase RecQ